MKVTLYKLHTFFIICVRSSDGKLLVVSSLDGYCSFIKFEEEELGIPIKYDPIEYQMNQAKIRKANQEKREKQADGLKIEKKAPEVFDSMIFNYCFLMVNFKKQL